MPDIREDPINGLVFDAVHNDSSEPERREFRTVSEDDMIITRLFKFSSCVRCYSDNLSEQENRERFGPRVRRHGHNYALEVSVAGEVDGKTGMVMNLVDLKEQVEREVLRRFDHNDLNESIAELRGTPATLERIAAVIWRDLESCLPIGRLARIRLWESEDCYVEIRGAG